MSEDDPVLLEVKDLTVERRELFSEAQIGLRNVSLTVEAGRAVAVCGETGCGKSALTRAIMRCLGPGRKVIGGSVELKGQDLLKLSRRGMRKVRRSEIAFIGSDVESQLNPSTTIHQHLWECIEISGRMDELGDEDEWSPYFYEVGIVEPEKILEARHSDLSGLMIQRVMLLSALFTGASLIICDDPTAELDIAAEYQFFEVLGQIKNDRNIGVLLTLGHINRAGKIADDISVLYEGGLLESGPAFDILRAPLHDYTREFSQSSPNLDRIQKRLSTVGTRPALEAQEAVHRSASSLEAASKANSSGSDSDTPEGNV